MKLFFLLAFVGLAASASLRPEVKIPTSPKQLEYLYDAQVATGMEEVSDDFSTARMRFRVQMQAVGDADSSEGSQRWRIVFKEANIRQRLNATESLPKTLLPLSQFRDIEDSDLWFKIEQALKKPFEAEIQQSRLTIRNVFFSDSDPFWSVNLKKGFLQTLQFDFMPTDSSDESARRGQWVKETTEMTTADQCKTLYTANKIPSLAEEGQMFEVEKAIDFHKCLNRLNGTEGLPAIWTGIAHSDPLQKQQQQQQQARQIVDVTNTGLYQIVMRQSRDVPVIRKASISTTYTVTPFGNSIHGSHRVIALQKLQLVRAEQQQAEVSEASSLKQTPEGLRLIFPQEEQNIDKEALLATAQQLMRQLVQRDQLNMTVYEQLLRIVRFHLSQKDQLQQLAQEFAKLPEAKKALRIFVLDIVPQVNTQGSMQFLMQIVESLLQDTRSDSIVVRGKLSRFDINAIFVKLSMQGNLQLSMLQEVQKTVQSEQFRSQLDVPELLPVQKSGWLCLGSMVNTYYARQGGVDAHNLWNKKSDRQSHFEKLSKDVKSLRQQHAQKSEQFRREFVQAVREQLNNESAMKIIALKVIKNSGLYELYDDLRSIILDRSSTTDMRKLNERVEAVYATQKMMQRMTVPRIFSEEDTRTLSVHQKNLRQQEELKQKFDKVSRQIQADLLNCFRNVREEQELRIASFRVLIQSPIRRTVLNVLLQRIRTEPAQQLRSYCIEFLSQISESQLSRYQQVKESIRSFLSYVKSREPRTQVYSRLFQGQMWNSLHEAGFSVETDLQFSDKAFTPRTAHIRIDHQSMGRNVPVVEIAIRSEGLQQVLEKMFGPRGEFYSNQVGGIRLLQRLTRQIRDNDKIEDMDIVTRFLKELPNMDVSISILGNEVIYVKASHQFISNMRNFRLTELVRELKQLKELFRPLTQVFTMGAGIQMPTTVGTILELNALMSIDFRPRVQYVSKNLQKGAEFKAQVAAPLTIQMLQKIGSNMHVLSHDNLFNSELQFNKDAAQATVAMQLTGSEKKSSDDKVELQELQISLLHSVPFTKTTILKIRSNAATVIREYNQDTKQTKILQKSLKHKKINSVTQQTVRPALNSLLQRLGMQVEVRSQMYCNQELFQAPCWFLLGPSWFEVDIMSARSDSTVVRHRLYLKQTREMFDTLKFQTAFVAAADFEDERQTITEVQIQKQKRERREVEFSGHVRYQDSDSADRRMPISIKIDLPEDLHMVTQESFNSADWIKPRSLKVQITMRNAEDQEFAQVDLQLSTNPKLIRLLQDSPMTQQQMEQMFPRMKKCLNESKRSIDLVGHNTERFNPLVTPSCLKQYREFNQLSAVKMQLKYKQRELQSVAQSQIAQTILKKIQQLLQPFLIKETVQQQPEDRREWAVIKIESRPSEVDTRVQHLDVQSQSKRSEWRAIQMPFQLFFWDGVYDLTTSATDFIKGGSSTCKVMNGHVKTFDDVIYSVPPRLYSDIKSKSCPVVLARDCSKTKLFQVSARSDSESYNIRVHMWTGRRYIVVDVTQNVDKRIPELRVDRHQIDVNDKDDGYVYHRLINTNDGPLSFSVVKITYAGQIFFKILSREMQLEFIVGGRQLSTVDIRTSPFYHNKVCGLCGDYNSEKLAEFRGVDGKQALTTPEKLFRQYIVPRSDQCQEMRQLNQHASAQENRIFQLIEDRQDMAPFNRRVPRCQVEAGKFVRTFWKSEVPMNPAPLRRALGKTDCRIKVTDVRLGDIELSLSQRPDEVDRMVIFIKESGRQPREYQIVAGQDIAVVPIWNDDVYQDINNADADKSLKLKLNNYELIIEVKANSVFNIQATHPRNGVCDVSDESEIRMGSKSFAQFAKKFTNANEDLSRTCAKQLHQNSQRCLVGQNRLTPFFHTDRDSSSMKSDITFSNQKLTEITASEQTRIPLSAARFSDASKISMIFMVNRQQNGKQLRDYLVQSEGKNLVKITRSQPFEQSELRIVYWKDGSEHRLNHEQKQTAVASVDDYEMSVKVSGDRIEVTHPREVNYGLIVPKSNDRVVVMQPSSPSSSHQISMFGGLCQTNHFSSLSWNKYSPTALLRASLEQSIRLQQSPEHWRYGARTPMAIIDSQNNALKKLQFEEEF